LSKLALEQLSVCISGCLLQRQAHQAAERTEISTEQTALKKVEAIAFLSVVFLIKEADAARNQSTP
jgi:hypothetical protein